MSSIVVRSFVESDRPAVEALYALTFGAEALRAWQARHRWQYFDHPETRAQPSRMWVGERSGKVVAYLAAFPMRLKIGDTTRWILLPCDLMVAKEARFGPNLGWKLMSECVAASSGFGLSLAHSSAAATLFEKLGWRAQMIGPIYMCPRDGAPVASRLLTPERMPARLKELPWPLLQRIATPVLTGALRAVNFAHRPRAAKALTVRPVSHFGAEYDALFAALAPRFPIIGVRDSAFLNWRFLDDPCTDHSVFAARDAHALRGYVAVCFAHARGVRFGRIMDLFCEPSDTRTIDALLRAGMDHLAGGGAQTIAARGLHPTIRARVRRYLYLAPSASQFTARVYCGDPALAPLMHADDNWHTAHADGDEDFAT